MAVRHPIFARLYERMAPSADKAGGAEHRRRLLEGLTGRVVEVGAGSGLNFPYYPGTVDEVVAVEPEPYLRRAAAEAAGTATVKVTVIEGEADAIPLPDESVDAGVASLVLCTVPDPAKALAELRRVIKPGGELRFYEHVAADDPKLLKLQQRVQVVWPWFSGGCNLNRRTEDAIRAAGFEIEDCDRFDFEPFPLAKPVAPHILGRARR